jgi:hypothetical protein
MQITVDITVGKGEKAVTHQYQVDSDDMPLALLEALQTGEAKLMRQGITDFLELPDEEAKHLTVRHVKQIGEALKAAQDGPNA